MENRELYPADTGRVLAVDDDESTVTLIELVLASAGFEVLTAQSGRAALEIIAKEQPGLVILDVMMPQMSGFEVCRKLREDPRFGTLPVIMLTALDDPDSRITGIEIGADDYLTKPFHNNELIARVRSVLRARKLDAALESSFSKYRRFNTYVENVTMGLDLELLLQNGLQQMIIGQFMAGGIPTSRSFDLLLVGTSSGIDKDAVLYNAYYLNGNSVERVSSPLPYVDIIRSLPYELSIGSRYGQLSKEVGDAVLASLPESVAMRVGGLRDAAVFAESAIYLAAFNYPRPVTQFDAEMLRGLSLYLSLGGRLSGLAAESDGAFRCTVAALARAAEANDTDTGNHIIRVNTYAGLLARELGMNTRFVTDIGFLAQLHDVGKIHIDRSILRKPGKLSPEEWAEMKKHTTYGARIIGDLPRLAMARTIALSHHERYDGRGYPQGLKGEEIPIEGRIVAIADVYDAIRNARSYKLEMPHDMAVLAIAKGDEKTPPGGFDPRVVNAFLRLEKQFDILHSTMK